MGKSRLWMEFDNYLVLYLHILDFILSDSERESEAQ